MTRKTGNTTKKSTGSTSRRKTKAEREAEKLRLQQIEEEKQWRRTCIFAVLLFALTIVAYTKMGLVGRYLGDGLQYLFGHFYYILTGLFVAHVILFAINRASGNSASRNPLGMILIILAFLMILSYLDTPHDLKGFEILQSYNEDLGIYFSETPPDKVGGGLFGALLVSLSTMLVDWKGTILVIAVLIIISLILLISLKVYKQAFATIKNYFATNEVDDDDEEDEEEEPAPAVTLKKQEKKPEKKPDNVISLADLPKVELGQSVPTVPNIRVDMDDTRDLPLPEPAPAATMDTVQIPLSMREPQKAARPEEGKEEKKSLFITADGPMQQQLSIIHEAALENEEVDEGYYPAYVPITPLRPYAGAETNPYPEADPYIAPDPYPYPEPEPYDEPEPYIEPAPVISEPEPPVVTPAPKPEPKPEPVKEDPAITNPRKAKNYRLPKDNLLDPIPQKQRDILELNKANAVDKGELLIQVLRNFDIEAQLKDYHIGPSVTKFEIKPNANVKVSRILNLADDIKMQLAVRDVRIEAPIPGYNAVGVEVPNQKAIPVKMRELIHNIPEKDQAEPLLIILGKDLMGNTVTCRLDKMPHLLIAGATGSGKSVCMNSIITSLLLRTKPEDVKLLLVDPKKVEFTPYQNIPHLIGPVINDPAQASNALKVIVKIMEDRYDMFSKAGVRNIQGFNTKVENEPAPADGSPKPEKMPYIVVIVDEMADLMLVAGKEVEASVQRITQLARAAGIHLIIATQRPSVDVITGVIKSNIPSRIAFAVSSGIDSRTILDHVGAERLLGNGDMLYMPIGSSNATRVQGVFVTDDEVQRIAKFCSDQQTPFYDDAFIRLDGVDGNEGTAVMGADSDPMLEEIKQFVIDQQKASTSLLQRHFGIGYNRAARMIDVLEEQGVIGPAQGSKPREVYIKKNA